MFALIIRMDQNFSLKPNGLHQGWIWHTENYVVTEQNHTPHKYFISEDLIIMAINTSVTFVS